MIIEKQKHSIPVIIYDDVVHGDTNFPFIPKQLQTDKGPTFCNSDLKKK